MNKLLPIALLVLGISSIASLGSTVLQNTHSLTQTKSAQAQTAVVAFPGAEGGGAQTKGGRGGRAIEVTNLNDTGTGSLRACIDATGPRVCIFKVGGTIVLNTGLTVKNPYLTIAGQTAPGGGILLRHTPTNTGRTLSIETNEVIVRYLRARPGRATVLTCCIDAMRLLKTNNVIVDHVSVSWAIDGNLDLNGAQNTTIQWSMIAEGLTEGHEKGQHSTNMLAVSYYTDPDGDGIQTVNTNLKNVSIHHNLFMSSNERSPRMHSFGTGPLDLVNNVVYNFGSTPSVVSDNYGSISLNAIANYYKAGPNTPSADTITPFAISPQNVGHSIKAFFQGNYMVGRSDVNSSDLGAVRSSDRKKPELFVSSPFPVPAVTKQSAASLPGIVLPQAGATKPTRDSVDTRLVNEFNSGTGQFPRTPADVGGWPVIANGTPYVDSDHDGMPNTWETQFGLNANSAADGPLDLDNDGYTNLEEFLNETLPGTATTIPSPPASPSAPIFPSSSPVIAPTPPPDAADVDGDGKVGIADFQAVLLNWLAPSTPSADVNKDGAVNGFDFAHVFAAYVAPSPVSSPAPVATPKPSATATPTPVASPSVFPSPSSASTFTISSLTLVNAATDTDIRTITNGDTINLATNPSISVRANPNNSIVKSARFVLTGPTPLNRSDNDAPIAIAQNSPTDYQAWTVTPGQYTLTVTPYSNANSSGVAGAPLTISFTVTK